MFTSLMYIVYLEGAENFKSSREGDAAVTEVVPHVYTLQAAGDIVYTDHLLSFATWEVAQLYHLF